jgi:hypothetical protein
VQKSLSPPRAIEVMWDIHFNWQDIINTTFIPDGIMVKKKNNETAMLTNQHGVIHLKDPRLSRA